MNHYFVTGASGGLGKAICELLLTDEHNRVTGISRSTSIDHPNFTAVTLDLSDASATLGFEFPHLDRADSVVLINNAGAIGEVGRVGELDNAQVAPNYVLNVSAPSVLSNSFASSYQGLDCKKLIINVSSGAASSAIGSWAMYCASKAALEMFSKVMATEQTGKEHPIQVLAVAPGIVDTGMQAHIRSSDPERFDRHGDFVDYHESGQLVSPEEVATKYVSIIDKSGSIDDICISVRDF